MVSSVTVPTWYGPGRGGRETVGTAGAELQKPSIESSKTATLRAAIFIDAIDQWKNGPEAGEPGQ